MKFIRLAVLACLLCPFGAAFADNAAALRERYAELRTQLAENSFGHPIHLDSSETPNALRGDIHAIVTHPFATVSSLKRAEPWCDILILVFNVKHCGASGAAPPQKLAVAFGRKFDSPLADAHKVEFRYGVPANSADYLRIELAAESGPLGTRDYRITFEAVPLDERRSFIHMRYSYAYGTAARLAMKGYLATIARDKVGFSVVERRADGSPVHVGGVRGVVERNTMRYYLAIDSYLDSLSAPPPQQVEKRLNGWFAATERYAPQLHEMELGEYLAMKRKEVQRLRTAVPHAGERPRPG